MNTKANLLKTLIRETVKQEIKKYRLNEELFDYPASFKLNNAHFLSGPIRTATKALALIPEINAGLKMAAQDAKRSGEDQDDAQVEYLISNWVNNPKLKSIKYVILDPSEDVL